MLSKEHIKYLADFPTSTNTRTREHPTPHTPTTILSISYKSTAADESQPLTDNGSNNNHEKIDDQTMHQISDFLIMTQSALGWTGGYCHSHLYTMCHALCTISYQPSTSCYQNPRNHCKSILSHIITISHREFISLPISNHSQMSASHPCSSCREWWVRFCGIDAIRVVSNTAHKNCCTS